MLRPLWQMENEGRLQTAVLEKESQIIASTMPIFQEEIKRLGARIDNLSAIILDKYSAIDLSQTQQKERDNLEKLIEYNQKRLADLLHHVMAQAKVSWHTTFWLGRYHFRSRRFAENGIAVIHMSKRFIVCFLLPTN